MVLTREDWTQVGYTSMATVTLLSTGICIAWSSAAIPHLLSGDVGYKITSAEASWVVSLFSFGCLLSSFYTKYALDMLGRKRTLLSAAFMFMTAWTLLQYGNAVWYLYVGRTLAGIGFGCSITACVMYVGEIADKSIRGGLNSITKFMIDFGQLFAYIIGAFFSYSTSNYIYAAVSLCTFASTAFLPETPYYCLKNRRRFSAEKAFIKLRSTNDEAYITREVDLIQKTVEGEMKHQASVYDFLTNKLYRKALIINSAMKLFQVASAYFIISSYIQSIIQDSGIAISPSTTSIIYGCSQLTLAIMTTFVIDKFGRKTLLIVSLISTVLAEFSIGCYFYIQDSMKADQEVMMKISWVPLTAIALFCFGYNIGIGPMTLILDGELYPVNVKATALAFGTIFSNVITVAFVKMYQIFDDAIGSFVPFWIFGSIMVLAVFFVIFVVPETNGKSFDAIQEELKRGFFLKGKHSAYRVVGGNINEQLNKL